MELAKSSKDSRAKLTGHSKNMQNDERTTHSVIAPAKPTHLVID